MRDKSWMNNNTLIKESFVYDPSKDYENNDDNWYELTQYMSKEIDKHIINLCRNKGLRVSKSDREEMRNCLIEIIQNEKLGDNYSGADDLESILKELDWFIIKNIGY